MCEVTRKEISPRPAAETSPSDTHAQCAKAECRVLAQVIASTPQARPKGKVKISVAERKDGRGTTLYHPTAMLEGSGESPIENVLTRTSNEKWFLSAESEDGRWMTKGDCEVELAVGFEITAKLTIEPARPLRLRLKRKAQARGGVRHVLVAEPDGARRKGETKSDGALDRQIPGAAQSGRLYLGSEHPGEAAEGLLLVFDEQAWKKDTDAWRRARLHNQGFYVGPIPDATGGENEKLEQAYRQALAVGRYQEKERSITGSVSGLEPPDG